MDYVKICLFRYFPKLYDLSSPTKRDEESLNVVTADRVTVSPTIEVRWDTVYV